MSSLPTPSEATSQEVPEPRPRPWYRKLRYLVPIMFVVWMTAIGAVFGDPSPERAEDTAAAPTPEPAEDRCVAADPFVMSAIAEGLIDPQGTRLSRGQAVRSNDYESLWFLATEVDSPEVEDGTVALWAVDRNDGDLGTIFAVDDTADMVSLWGDVVVPSSPPLPTDEGAAEAVACSRAVEDTRGIVPPSSPSEGR
jgi:hypothetical protein